MSASSPASATERTASVRWTKGVYALIGPDGAGKTTIMRAIAARLHESGVRTRVSWMRSPRISTLAVLGVLRMSGLAKTVRMGDHDDVHTDLKDHRALFHLLAWAVTFDYFLGYLGKVSLPKHLLRRTILCDRFVWDALVDLGLASGVDEAVLEFPQGQILLKLARKHRSALVSTSTDELLRRRPILSLDPRLERRLRLYHEYARRFALGEVDSGRTSEEESARQVMEYLGISP
jgi:thymidylate kinase